MVKLRQIIQYQDYINNLFPAEIENIKKSDTRVDKLTANPLYSAKSITFQVTDACNLRCTYCYQHNKSTRRMSFETAKRYIDLVLSGDKGFYEYLGPSYAVVLDFIGGEPLLEIDLIDKICDYFIKRCLELNHPWLYNYRISICSNGVLYFNEKVQTFLRKHLNKLSFDITLDGNKTLHDSCRVFPDGTGSFDLAYSAIKDWTSRGYYMGSKITLSPYNLKYMYDACVFMIENGYKDININCVFEEGWTIEDAQLMYKELKRFADYMLNLDNPQDIYFRFWSTDMYTNTGISEYKNPCGGDGSMIACDPVGDVYPCIRYMDSSLNGKQKPLKIGDVYEGIGKHKCDRECMECLRGVKFAGDDQNECRTCTINKSCMGCSAYDYQVNGTLHQKTTFHCWMTRAQALANWYYINKLNKKIEDKDRLQSPLPEDIALQIIDKSEYDYLVELSKEE